MTYTCATEGCGEPIYWDTMLAGRWRHERSDNLTCVVLGSWLAHPAGGTNTTPPEELERDVKKVTMDQIRQATRIDNEAMEGVVWRSIVRPLIQSYADQAVEEATADLKVKLDNLGQELSDSNRANDQLTRRLVNAKAEVTDLREQLDRALVPKLKVGDRVKNTHITIDGSVTNHTYRVIWDEKWYGDYLEADLTPLETECQQWCHDESYRNEYGSWKVCPWCGESLTKETP